MCNNNILRVHWLFWVFFQHIPLLHMHIDDFLQFRLFVLCSSPLLSLSFPHLAASLIHLVSFPIIWLFSRRTSMLLSLRVCLLHIIFFVLI